MQNINNNTASAAHADKATQYKFPELNLIINVKLDNEEFPCGGDDEVYIKRQHFIDFVFPDETFEGVLQGGENGNELTPWVRYGLELLDLPYADVQRLADRLNAQEVDSEGAHNAIERFLNDNSICDDAAEELREAINSD